MADISKDTSKDDIAAASTDRGEILQSIERNADLLSGRIPTTARVVAPDEELIRVELVPLWMVRRADELNNDTNLFSSMFWMLLGSLVGVAVSLLLTPIPAAGIEMDLS